MVNNFFNHQINSIYTSIVELLNMQPNPFIQVYILLIYSVDFLGAGNPGGRVNLSTASALTHSIPATESGDNH